MFTGRINTVRNSTILSVLTKDEDGPYIGHFLCVGNHRPYMTRGLTNMPSGLSDTQFEWFTEQIKLACRPKALHELDPNMIVKGQPLTIRCNARRCPQLSSFLIDTGAVITEEIAAHYLNHRQNVPTKFYDAIPVDLKIDGNLLIETVSSSALAASLINRGCTLTPEIVTGILERIGKYEYRVLIALVKRGIELDGDLLHWIVQGSDFDEGSCVLGTHNWEAKIEFLIRMLHIDGSRQYAQIKEYTERYGIPASVILEAAVRANNYYVASRFLDRVEKTDEMIWKLKCCVSSWNKEMLAILDGGSTLF